MSAARRLCAAILLLLGLVLSGILATPASAQTAPVWAKGYVPPPNEWEGEFGGKVDVFNGTLTNPSFNGTLGGTGLSTFLASPPAIGGTAPATGAFTALSASRLSTSVSSTWSGTSSPNAALSPLFSTEALGGVSTNGGSPPLNYFSVTNNFAGLASTAYWFEDDTHVSLGGHVAILGAAANDSYNGYTRPLWVTGATYAAGQVVTVNQNVIYATSSGVAGASTPTCSLTTATCSDGTVSWAFDVVMALDPNMVGAIFKANPTVSWGGTSVAPIGTSYGLNTLATCAAGFQVLCYGYELNVGIPSGNAAQYRVGQQIITERGASVAGAVEDTAWRIGSQGSGAAPWQNLMTWSSYTSATVLAPTGYGLQAYSQNGNTTTPSFMAGAGAIDMLEFAPSGSGPFGAGFDWRSPGAQILGTGDVQSNFSLLHVTATGESLDVPEYQVTGATVNSGGSGWTCTGKWARGSNGSIVSIGSISGGAVATISLVLGAFSTSNLTAETFTAEQPGNCGIVSATGSNTPPSTFTATETSVQANSGAPVLTLGGVATLVIGNLGSGTAEKYVCVTSTNAVVVQTSPC